MEGDAIFKYFTQEATKCQSKTDLSEKNIAGLVSPSIIDNKSETFVTKSSSCIAVASPFSTTQVLDVDVNVYETQSIASCNENINKNDSFNVDKGLETKYLPNQNLLNNFYCNGLSKYNTLCSRDENDTTCRSQKLLAVSETTVTEKPQLSLWESLGEYQKYTLAWLKRLSYFEIAIFVLIVLIVTAAAICLHVIPKYIPRLVQYGVDSSQIKIQKIKLENPTNNSLDINIEAYISRHYSVPVTLSTSEISLYYVRFPGANDSETDMEEAENFSHVRTFLRSMTETLNADVLSQIELEPLLTASQENWELGQNWKTDLNDEELMSLRLMRKRQDTNFSKEEKHSKNSKRSKKSKSSKRNVRELQGSSANGTAREMKTTLSTVVPEEDSMAYLKMGSVIAPNIEIKKKKQTLDYKLRFNITEIDNFNEFLDTLVKKNRGVWFIHGFFDITIYGFTIHSIQYAKYMVINGMHIDFQYMMKNPQDKNFGICNGAELLAEATINLCDLPEVKYEVIASYPKTKPAPDSSIIDYIKSVSTYPRLQPNSFMEPKKVSYFSTRVATISPLLHILNSSYVADPVQDWKTKARLLEAAFPGERVRLEDGSPDYNSQLVGSTHYFHVNLTIVSHNDTLILDPLGFLTLQFIYESVPVVDVHTANNVALYPGPNEVQLYLILYPLELLKGLRKLLFMQFFEDILRNQINNFMIQGISSSIPLYTPAIRAFQFHYSTRTNSRNKASEYDGTAENDRVDKDESESIFKNRSNGQNMLSIEDDRLTFSEGFGLYGWTNIDKSIKKHPLRTLEEIRSDEKVAGIDFISGVKLLSANVFFPESSYGALSIKSKDKLPEIHLRGQLQIKVKVPFTRRVTFNKLSIDAILSFVKDANKLVQDLGYCSFALLEVVHSTPESAQANETRRIQINPLKLMQDGDSMQGMERLFKMFEVHEFIYLFDYKMVVRLALESSGLTVLMKQVLRQGDPLELLLQNITYALNVTTPLGTFPNFSNLPLGTQVIEVPTLDLSANTYVVRFSIDNIAGVLAGLSQRQGIKMSTTVLLQSQAMFTFYLGTLVIELSYHGEYITYLVATDCWLRPGNNIYKFNGVFRLLNLVNPARFLSLITDYIAGRASIIFDMEFMQPYDFDLQQTTLQLNSTDDAEEDVLFELDTDVNLTSGTDESLQGFSDSFESSQKPVPPPAWFMASLVGIKIPIVVPSPQERNKLMSNLKTNWSDDSPLVADEDEEEKSFLGNLHPKNWGDLVQTMVSHGVGIVATLLNGN